MNKLLIYGAGGSGREFAENLSLGSVWNIEGFLDDTPEKQGQIINGIPVLGGIEYLKSRIDCPSLAICTALDYPVTKKQLINKIKELCGSVKFPIISVSHNIVSQYAEIGEGTLIAQPYNLIHCNVKIGKFVWINPGNGIGHDATIGDYTTLYSRINVGGSVQIGRESVIGSGAVIRPKVVIGNNVIVGGGSVVVKDVPDNVVVAGNPAKILREIGKSLEKH